MNSGLPWILPKKAFGLDLNKLTDTMGVAIGEGADATSIILGFATTAGLGLLAFSEVETILQLLGSAALIQFFSKKLLFAEVCIAFSGFPESSGHGNYFQEAHDNRRLIDPTLDSSF